MEIQDKPQEQEQSHEPKPRSAGPDVYLKWGVLLACAVLVYLFAANHAKDFASTDLEINFKDQRFALKTSALKTSQDEIAKLDPSAYIIDSLGGFAFLKLDPQYWAAPQNLAGIEAVFKAKSLPLESLKGMAESKDPMARLLREVKMIRYVSGSPMAIAIPFPGAKKDIEVPFLNELTVAVYDKALLESPLPLPSFFLYFMGILNLPVDQLSADKNSILAGFSASVTGGADLKGQTVDIRRLLFFAENKNHFYLAEIAYSPQSKDARAAWNDLNRTLQSFRVLE